MRIVPDPVEYTLTQFRDIVGLSLETHRHWKRVLPPLTVRQGRAPCFTVGDIIAGAVVRHLTDVGGLKVGHLADISDALFALCNRTPWAALTTSLLVFDCDRRHCQLITSSQSQTADGLVLIVPLQPVLERIRASLLKDIGDERQTSLCFPPLGIPAGRRKVRA